MYNKKGDNGRQNSSNGKKKQSKPLKSILCRKTTYKNENNEIIEINFDDLEIISEIGSGQYGTVLKFLHNKSNMILAAKKISCTSENEDQQKEIMDLKVPLEVGNYDFIVKFYGGLCAESYIWILSEVMDTSLDKFYAKASKIVKVLDETFIAKVAYCSLMGIKFLKSKSIMHRDIKPSNILINRDGKIKLCDFGISGFINNSVCLTITGCCPYMAPEKIKGTDVFDRDSYEGYTVKADIWSLGISLYEIATFKHPFENARTFCARMTAVIDNLSPELPKDRFSSKFCDFIDKCLVKEPDERGDLSLVDHEFISSNHDENFEFHLNLEFIGNIINQIQNE